MYKLLNSNRFKLVKHLKNLKSSSSPDRQVFDALKYYFKYYQHLYSTSIIRCYYTKYLIQTGSNSSVKHLKSLKIIFAPKSSDLEYHLKYHLYFHIHVAIIFTNYSNRFKLVSQTR